MNRKLVVCLLFLFFSIETVFCAEEPPQKKCKIGQEPEEPFTLSTIRRSERVAKRKKRVADQDAEKLRNLTLDELYEKTQTGEVSISDLNSLSKKQKNGVLWKATEDQNLPVFENLLCARADPNTKNKYDTPLLNYLVSDSYGASYFDSNFYDKNRHKKSLDFDCEAINILLQHNPDTNLQHKGDYSSLQVAASDNYTTCFGFTPHYSETFYFETLKNKFNNVRKLVQKNADPNLNGGKNCSSSLHLAVINDYGKTFLNGNNLNRKIEEKSLNFKKKIVQVLLTANANPNIPDAYNDTPLHLAASVGYFPTICLLLERGANTKARNQDGLMPMHVAAARDSRDYPISVIMLLQYGADLSAKTPEGDTVLSLMTNPVTVEVIKGIKLLRIAENPLFLACLAPNVGLVCKLIAENVDVNQKDKSGTSVLMCAASIFNRRVHSLVRQAGAEVVKKLLAARANPLTEADDGTTALTQADGDVKKMIQNAILAKKRSEIFGLFEILSPELAEIILKLMGTYEPIS